MSYEQLAASVDELSAVNSALTAAVDKSQVDIVEAVAESTKQANIARDAANSASETAESKIQDFKAELNSQRGVSMVPSAVSALPFKDTQTSPNVNSSISVWGTPGNPDSSSTLYKTGATVPSKAGKYEPPYVYDINGVEYLEKRPVSFQYVPKVVNDTSPKLVIESPYNPGQIFVVVKKETQGYLLVGLANNITTNNADSLGASGSEKTMYRVVSVQSAVAAVVGFKGSPIESKLAVPTASDWTHPSLSTVLPEIPPFTSSFAYTYYQTRVKDAVLSYSSVPVDNGSISLQFVVSPSSNPAASVTVDGVETLLNLTSTTTRIKTFTWPSFKDSVSVAIKNSTDKVDAVYVNFLGFNFSTLDKWSDRKIDAWGYYRNTAESDYILSNSENDYTMKEYTSQIYGGGYHGGEKGVVDNITVDGAAYSLKSTATVGRDVRIKSSCSIDWSSVGVQSSVNVIKNYTFVKGGYYTGVMFNGKITLAELYSALFGASQLFSLVDAPKPYVIKDVVSNNSRLNLGRTNKAVMRNPSTNQTITAEYTVHQDDSASQYGGVYVWRVDGTYNKLYYSQAHAGRLATDGSYSMTKYTFE